MTLYSICIATYRRPDGLQALLESIEAQRLTDDMAVEILVVDNDPTSAEPVVSSFAERSRFPVRYLTQPEQNISITRNVAVAAANGEFLWFVDDDETAVPDCLRLLAEAMTQHNADAVFGPVVPLFEAGEPEWVRGATVFNRPIKKTGTIATGYRTSNTLVRSEILTLVDGPFDPDFGVSGGSDSMLFRVLAEKGLRFIDSGDAIVHEAVPPHRSTWEWMRNRVRRQGQNYARQTVLLNQGALTKPVGWMLSKALLQLITTGVRSVAPWSDETQRTNSKLRMWSNVGKFEGVRGSVTERAL